MSNQQKTLQQYGFSFEQGGAHTSRTMMLEEFEELIKYVGDAKATKQAYLQAIVNDNCLGKRSGKTRTLTYRHLVDLYSLSAEVVLFRSLLSFWERDLPGHPLLLMLCAYARDPILRVSASLIQNTQEGKIITRDAMEELIETTFPGRFSKATLKSTAQNVNATWTQAGRLTGRAVKTRTKATPTAGSLAYALLLGYLSGVRGQSLFQTEYVQLLDCPYDKAIDLAEEASRKGWIVFKRVGTVMETLFPNLISSEEMENPNE